MRVCRCLSLVALCALGAAPVGAGELEPLLAALRAVGPEGAGHRQAAAAWEELARADAADLPAILAGLDGAGPLAANWIRGAVDAIAERTLAGGGQLPAAELEAFLLDTSHAPRGRRLAYEWLARVDATAPDRIIPRLLDDPSVEFRRDAVARLLDQAAPLFDAQAPGATELYERALTGARDADQIDLIADRLLKLGRPVDLPRHFGFLMRWRLIGPFDNTGKKGFDVAYPPETEARIDFSAEHAGKQDAVRWIEHETTDSFGRLDLNQALGKNMGAVAYAYTEFVSDAARDVQLRLACTNANKVWLNGERLGAFEVYHAGNSLDQYVLPAHLRKGRNTILIKACQNEQTDPWAQDWAFQLRVCDEAGTAVLAADRDSTRSQSAAGGR